MTTTTTKRPASQVPLFRSTYESQFNAHTNQSKPNITIGFLSSFRYGMGKLIAGAIPLAVEEVNRREDLLPNHTLQFVAGDSGDPESYMAIRKMTAMREQENVVAFIGPDHSCVSEALVAAAWEFPMITYVSNSS